MLVTHLYGGPGTGKSTTAALVFGRLKQLGFNAELVTEFAKDLTWEQAHAKLADQITIFAEQRWRLERLADQVEVVVTDTSTLLSLIYDQRELTDAVVAFHKLVAADYKERDNFDFFLSRNVTRRYNPSGRNQDVAEAIALDRRIHLMLRNHNIGTRTVKVEENFDHVDLIVDRIVAKLRPC